MTGVNGNDSFEYSKEAANSQQKPNTESLETKLYNEFVSRRIQKDGVSFMNQYMAMPDTEDTYKDEMMSFAHSDDAFDAIDSDFRDKISLGRIQRKIAPEMTKIKFARTNFKNLYLKHYDVTTEKYNSDIASIVESTDLSDLKRYSTSLVRMQEFFSDNGIDIPEKKKHKDILEQFDCQSRFKKLPVKERQLIAEKLDQSLQGLSPLSPLFVEKFSAALSALVTTGLLSLTEKRELLEHLVPTVSLKQAKKLWLISDRDIEKFLKDNFLSGIDTSHHDNILEWLQSKLDEIQVSTSDLGKMTDAQVDSIFNTADFGKLAREIQDFQKYGQEGSIASFDVLKERLPELEEKILGISDIAPGKTLKLDVKRGQIVSEEYYEVLSIGTGDGVQDQIVLQNKWGNGVYNPNGTKLDYFSYGDFFKKLQEKEIQSGSVLTRDLFKDKVANGEIDQVEGEFTYSLDSDKPMRIEQARDDLAQKLHDAEKTKTKLDGKDLDDFIANMSPEDKNFYKKEIDLIEGDVNDFNVKNLLQQLDKNDSKGVIYGLELGTSMIDPKSGDSYTIAEIYADELPKGRIIITGIGTGREEVDFEQFFEVFSERRMQRTAKVANDGMLEADVNAEDALWDGVSVKDGMLYNESYTDEKHRKCQYLATNDEKNPFWKEYTALKIHNISGNNVEISLGKVEKTKKGDKKDDPTDTTFSIGKDKIIISLGILSTWIKTSGLQAKSLEGENASEKEAAWNVKKDSRKWTFWGWYLASTMSISSIVSGGKMWVDNMENYFKQYGDEQATQFLSKLPVFTDEQRVAMNMRIEQAQKKQTDESIELLKVLDSGPATKMIADWILDKYSTQWQKEAALLYMMEKYGVLYEKKALIKHKWDFIWYQAFWGREWDAFFQNYKKECEEDNLHFTEEGLMYAFIANQCKWDKPKLRGKLYKELEAIMGKWLDAELQKGKDDADKKWSYNAKEKFALGELEDGGFPNAIGAFESMIGKGTPDWLPGLNKLPFVMLTSGEAKSFPAALTNKFKANSFVLSAFFVHSKSDVENYNKVVLELSRDIEKKLPWKYEGMYEAADKLINKSAWRTSKERVIAATKFYEKYQDVLGRALLWLNTRKQDAEAEFETWIRDHKDTNPHYRNYFNTFQVAFENTKDSEWGKEEILKDAYATGTPGAGGLTGYNVKEFTKKFITPQNWGVWFRNQALGEMYWGEITSQIDSLVSNEHVSNEYKRRRIWQIVSAFMDGIAPTYAQRGGMIDLILQNPADVFYKRFHQWWVTQDDFYLDDGSFESSSKWQRIIERYVDNIMLSWWTAVVHDFSLKNIQEGVQKKAAANLNIDPYDT